MLKYLMVSVVFAVFSIVSYAADREADIPPKSQSILWLEDPEIGNAYKLYCEEVQKLEAIAREQKSNIIFLPRVKLSDQGREKILKFYREGLQNLKAIEKEMEPLLPLATKEIISPREMHEIGIYLDELEYLQDQERIQLSNQAALMLVAGIKITIKESLEYPGRRYTLPTGKTYSLSRIGNPSIRIFLDNSPE